jgi:hypothetical protein
MKQFFYSLGFLILMSGFSVGDLKSMEVQQEDAATKKQQHLLTANTEEDVLDEILNGRINSQKSQ